MSARTAVSRLQPAAYKATRAEIPMFTSRGTVGVQNDKEGSLSASSKAAEIEGATEVAIRLP